MYTYSFTLADKSPIVVLNFVLITFVVNESVLVKDRCRSQKCIIQNA